MSTEFNDLKKEIDELKNEVYSLKKTSRFQGFAGNAFSKLSIAAGIFITVLIASVLLYAAQISFTDGTVISASDVNHNFNELYTAVQEINDRISMTSKVINVTVHRNDTSSGLLPLAALIELDTFTVDKKSPTSILIIQGTINTYISPSAQRVSYFSQYWQYGSESEAQGQTFSDDNSNYLGNYEEYRPIPTSAIISGHATTGPQTLKLVYKSRNGVNGRPFHGYNVSLGSSKTESVYTVWEVEM